MDTLIKPSLLALTIASALSGNANAEIIISQYVEGGSYNKAVEIANTGDTAVTLTGFELAKSLNGDGAWGSKIDLSGVTLQANQVYVLAHGDASAAIQAVADITDKNVANFNGDDPLALLKDGQVHDIVGVMGDVSFGQDTTLVRNSDALVPSATFQSDQWTVLAKDNIEGLGELNAAEPPEPFACEVDGNAPVFTSIQEIQGEGASSPFINGYPYITTEDYFVTGVVSAVTTGLTKGFYLQALENDGNDNTSEGLFIHTDTADSELKPGDVVCVKGKVQEYYSNTQLSSDAASYVKTGTSDIPVVTVLNIKDGETLRDALERHEGMQVVLQSASELFVTRNFSYDYDARRNNMMLSYQAPLFKPTQLHAAESDAAVALAKDNTNNRVYLESDSKAPDGQIPYYPTFGEDSDQDGSSEQHIRLGSRIEGLQGVVNYSYNEYRLIATNEVDSHNFVTSGDGFDVTRKAAPAIADSDLRVASFNVLNYFTSAADSGNDNPTGQNRGATNYDEFLIQQAKIVAAMNTMDADIIGLMEIENNGFGEGSAIQNLVDALNADIADADDHYTYVEIADQDKYQEEFFGSDAIMVALLYRAKSVTPKEAAKVIMTPEQHVAENSITRNDGAEGNPAYDQYQRHSLLQTFTVQATGEDLSVVVNHFKSKGSECIEEWIAGVEGSEPEDLQGNCNNFRVSAAQVVGETLKDIDGDVLVLGDLNAYGKEDPLLTLTDYSKEKYGRDIYTAAYTTIGGGDLQVEKTQIQQGYGLHNLNTLLHGNDTFSYTYSGELGNLDHALASSSLAQKVVAIEDWHINSLESNLFEYSSQYTGDMPKYNDAFSASDHDPVIIAIDYPDSDLKLPKAGGKLTLAMRLPPNALAGDVATISFTSAKKAAANPKARNYGASATLTQGDIDARSVTLEFNKKPAPGTYQLQEQITDAADNTMKFSSQHQVSLKPSSGNKPSKIANAG
ncbi:ExeM/NucH family extracellular endonuclease [Vibrio sp. FJH11]